MAWQAIRRLFTRKQRPRAASSISEEIYVGDFPIGVTREVPAPRVETVVADELSPVNRESMMLDDDWVAVINTARYMEAQAQLRERLDEVVQEELRQWVLGNVASPAARLAEQLRVRFGARAPTAANAVMGERFLLDKAAEAGNDHLDASNLASLAVNLWLVRTAWDQSVGLGFPSGW
ncbi:methyltransferase [Wheat umbra-like virus]|nr:methyltransferase [Wheat umbra-like virus]